jgi:hypothetical protein
MSSPESGSSTGHNDTESSHSAEPESFAFIKQAWEEQGRSQRAGSGQTLAADTQQRRAYSSSSRETRETIDLVEDHERVARQASNMPSRSSQQIIMDSGEAALTKRRQLLEAGKGSSSTTGPAELDEQTRRGLTERVSSAEYQLDRMAREEFRAKVRQEQIAAARKKAEANQKERDNYRAQTSGNDGQGH